MWPWTLQLLYVRLITGAHSIERARCGIILSRLYNFKGRGQADPSINPVYLTTLRQKCPPNAARKQNRHGEQDSERPRCELLQRRAAKVEVCSSPTTHFGRRRQDSLSWGPTQTPEYLAELSSSPWRKLAVSMFGSEPRGRFVASALPQSN